MTDDHSWDCIKQLVLAKISGVYVDCCYDRLTLILTKFQIMLPQLVRASKDSTKGSFLSASAQLDILLGNEGDTNTNTDKFSCRTNIRYRCLDTKSVCGFGENMPALYVTTQGSAMLVGNWDTKLSKAVMAFPQTSLLVEPENLAIERLFQQRHKGQGGSQNNKSWGKTTEIFVVTWGRPYRKISKLLEIAVPWGKYSK